MISPRIERRLAAILAADVAGYSRLMGTDEIGTLTALKAHRRERIDPTIARHNGRIFNTTGDGLLVEFASVVDAVGCAVAIQRAMLAFNAGLHTERQIVLRIGINVGDIIIDGGDIFGDGVNVAARLEALCEPGGVCISRYANEQVSDKLSLAFADLGEQTVKNIARAIGVFGLAPKDIAALPEDALPEPEPPESRTPLMPARRRPAGAMVAVGVAVAALLAAGGWWMLHDRTSLPVVASVSPSAPRPAPYSPQDRRASLIVLPFENSSGDPAQDGIAAALTRDVIGHMSAVNPVRPIVPEATAAVYWGKTPDLRAIGRDHDVHFALTGHAHQQDGRLIVAATLYETENARHLWSQQFDRPDRPSERNGIIGRIYSNIDQAMTDAEVARAKREYPDNLDKRDLLLASLVTPLQQNSKANLLAQIALLERALALDPNYVIALRRDAQVHAYLVLNVYSSNPDADLAIATKMADRAQVFAPNDTEVLKTKATVLRAQGIWDGAAAILRTVIERHPLQADSYRELGSVLLAQGYREEALEHYMTAKQLAGEGDLINIIDANIAIALLANDRYPEAIAQARLAIGEFPAESGISAEFAWLALIAAEGANGRDAVAHAALQKFLATPRTLRTMDEIQKLPYFAANAMLLERLRRAGMPEN